MSMLDKQDPGRPGQAGHLHRRDHAGHRRARGPDRQPQLRERPASYKAIFSDATGVVKGDDIRIAGVKVGSVKSVEIVDRTRALVTFNVATPRSSQAAPPPRSATATSSASATSRSPRASVTQPVARGATIPMSRTQPALDLTVLFNGFKPLFAALSPADINKLCSS